MNSKKTYNILIIHNQYQYAGGEDSVVENEKQMLLCHGHKVVMYSRSNDELKTIGGKFLYLFSFLFSRKSYRDVTRFIQEQEIDIVHVHNSFPLITPSVYYAAKKQGVKIVQTLHNFRLLCPNALLLRDGKVCEECIQKGVGHSVRYGCYRNSRIQTAMAALTLWYHRKRRSYNLVDAFIILTEFDLQFFKHVFPALTHKMVVKPNFVPDKNIVETKSISEGKSIAETYDIYIGRLSQEKGILRIVDAYLEMPKNSLYIVGEGPLEEKIRYSIEKSGASNIKMLGYLQRRQAMELLAGARVSVMASTCYESFGMGIVESFAMKVPVVAGNLGNASQMVQEGYNGFLFSYDSTEALKICILNIKNEMLLQMKENAYHSYRERYSEEENYEMLINIYQK